MATPSLSLSLIISPPFKISRPKPYTHNLTPPPPPPPPPPPTSLPSPLQRKPFHSRKQETLRISRISRIRAAAAEEVLPPESTASQQIVSATGDDGVSAAISALLFVAFLTLSLLTIGVIYISVTDYLQKREREKLDKEEAGKNKKKKKSGKGGKVRSSAGPRGFGQKVDDFDDEL